ncbi:hypothetical protein JAAARDRAFT_40812 [Jaapia argillacea MUCL 33604]|uniref:Uncharacterized protein n=2 Tax=Jaapia argillacea MUCL 33604 TaxID=933084 RepID=A0A067PL82_9AGAM|nr:hypothetical protein JAAARDRAFT_40812 [Jaapia argillacea MUCL 33604]
MSSEPNTLTDIFGLTGKVGFVTGGASGLGLEISKALALAGAHVVVADINLSGAQNASESILSLGAQSIAVQIDVTSEQSVQNAVSTAVAHFGSIDILFNNAGIADPVPSLLHEYDTSNWHKVISVILTGTYHTSKAILPHMLKQGYGKIINIASMWGLSGSSSVFPIPAYTAAKGAVVNLTRELGLQYAKENIQVNAICPGFYRTNLAGGAYGKKEFVDAITAFTPMGRIAEAHEIRGPAIYLASSASDFMTGQMVVVDGGCQAK